MNVLIHIHFINTLWSPRLSNESFFSVISVFKSVISVTKIIVRTYIRSCSAWHIRWLSPQENSSPSILFHLPTKCNGACPPLLDWQSSQSKEAIPLAPMTHSYTYQWLLPTASFTKIYSIPLSGVSQVPLWNLLQLICKKKIQ